MVGVMGGDDMVAADINDILLYLPRWYTKPGATSRNSGNHTPGTPSADPDLTGIPLEVGSFEIEVLGFFTLTTTSTQKLRTMWGFSGTWNTTTIRMCSGPGSTSVSTPDDATSANIRGNTIATQSADYDAGTSSAYSSIREICMDVQVTVAGNFSLLWAQAVSSANNTTLQAPTAVKVTRKRT